MKTIVRTTLLAVALTAAAQVQADITIGVSLPLTGPASGLGIPSKNGLALWPETIGGEKIKLILLDDATDPSLASKNARRFAIEDKVDVIIGSVATPSAIAISGVAEETQTVQLSLAPVDLPEGKGGWTFRLPQSMPVMATGVLRHMKSIGVKNYGFIGYADGYGESWLKEMSRLGPDAGIALTTAERYARSDTSVTGQALKVIAGNPDAILIVASGSGAALPHKTLIERGYKGKIYQTHGAASRDLIRLGGKDVEGSFVISGLAVLPEALPDTHPSKKMAMRFVEDYEKMYGPNSRNQFAASIYDAQLVLQRAVPLALKKGATGTPAFRIALKEALENMGAITITQGVMHYTASDHFGLGAWSRMMLTVENGNWKSADAR